MITLSLFGYLAEIHGEEVTLDVSTPREAVTALAYQCKKYKKYLLEHSWYVLLGPAEDGITPAELDVKLGNITHIRLIPAIEGASSSWRKNAIIGGALLVVGIVAAPFTGGASLALTNYGAWAIFGGTTLLIGAAVGHAYEKAMKVQDPVDSRPSFIYEGPKNTAAQGGPIPLGYGRMLIGSHVISAGLYAEDTK